MNLKSVSYWIKKLLIIKMVSIVILGFAIAMMPIIEKNMASTQPNHENMWQLADQSFNPDYVMINRYIDQAKTDIPKDIVKAVAWCESEWRHFDNDGKTLTGVNRKITQVGNKTVNTYTLDWGIMQINDRNSSLDVIWCHDLIRDDPKYNIQAGIAVLREKQAYIRYLKNLPDWERIARRYDLIDKDEIDILLKAYNGFQSSWHYVNKVKKTALERPWEKKMLVQMGSDFYYPLMITDYSSFEKQTFQTLSFDISEKSFDSENMVLVMEISHL